MLSRLIAGCGIIFELLLNILPVEGATAIGSVVGAVALAVLSLFFTVLLMVATMMLEPFDS